MSDTRPPRLRVMPLLGERYGLVMDRASDATAYVGSVKPSDLGAEFFLVFDHEVELSDD